MRTLVISSCACLFLFVQSIAQSSGDCRTAIPVCADAPIFSAVDGSGDIDDFDPENVRETGCLEKGSVSSANIENSTAWYVFRAGSDGQIGFDIEALPVNPGDPITSEYDFALYGPFDQTTGDNFCGTIGDASVQPIRCNYEVNNTAFTGMGVNPENGQVGAPNVTGSGNTYDEFVDVIAGEIYYLLINNFNTNFDGNPEPFSLTFTGSSVNANQDTALDCAFRDEFLGLDIIACEGDPDIVLSAQTTPAGPNVSNITWSVDYGNDGTIDVDPLLQGQNETQLTITTDPANSGRYYVEVLDDFGVTYTDDVLVTIYGPPELDEVVIIDDFLNSDQTDPYNIRIEALGDGDYEYAINGGEFQDDPTFLDVPPGINTVIINDKNGCGTTEPIEFLVVGYPKFFTPNGDTFNDTWQVKGIEQLTNPSVFIFDRYGKLLKQLNPTELGGWDGTFNGRELPSSDYWFKLDYERDDENVLVARTVRRHFTLKR